MVKYNVYTPLLVKHLFPILSFYIVLFIKNSSSVSAVYTALNARDFTFLYQDPFLQSLCCEN